MKAQLKIPSFPWKTKRIDAPFNEEHRKQLLLAIQDDYTGGPADFTQAGAEVVSSRSYEENVSENLLQQLDVSRLQIEQTLYEIILDKQNSIKDFESELERLREEIVSRTDIQAEAICGFEARTADAELALRAVEAAMAHLEEPETLPNPIAPKPVQTLDEDSDAYRAAELQAAEELRKLNIADKIQATKIEEENDKRRD